MQACTLLQTDNHANTPPLSFLQAGCPSCRPTNSVKALKYVDTEIQLLLDHIDDLNWLTKISNFEMSIWQSYGQQQRDNFWLKVANRPVFLHQRVNLPLYHSSRLSSPLLIIVRYTGVCVYTNTLTYLLPWNSGLKQCYTRNETAQNAVVGAKLRWMIQVTAWWHSRLMMTSQVVFFCRNISQMPSIHWQCFVHVYVTAGINTGLPDDSQSKRQYSCCRQNDT